MASLHVKCPPTRSTRLLSFRLECGRGTPSNTQIGPLSQQIVATQNTLVRKKTESEQRFQSMYGSTSCDDHASRFSNPSRPSKSDPDLVLHLRLNQRLGRPRMQNRPTTVPTTKKAPIHLMYLPSDMMNRPSKECHDELPRCLKRGVDTRPLRLWSL
jgi:hypothetical protein